MTGIEERDYGLGLNVTSMSLALFFTIQLRLCISSMHSWQLMRGAGTAAWARATQHSVSSSFCILNMRGQVWTLAHQ